MVLWGRTKIKILILTDLCGLYADCCGKRKAKLAVQSLKFFVYNVLMHKSVLDELFGGYERLKLIKLFVFSPETAFDLPTIAKRTVVSPSVVKRELTRLIHAGFLKEKKMSTMTEKNRGGKKIFVKKKTKGWIISPSFIRRQLLEDFLIQTSAITHGEIIKKTNKVGRAKLVLTSGMFIGDQDSRLDMVFVCDKVNRKTLDKTIKYFESLMGREIRYTALETADFQYRLSMRDKLVRDILDYPHEVVLDKLGVTNG